ncbi:hypothetical protein LXL04_033946 [Taraxacum kok-saghyz]
MVFMQVMDMEHEFQALRVQLAEKSKRSIELQKKVVIIQMNNGVDHPSESIHVLHVGKMRMKLCKGKTTVAKEYYSPSMHIIFTAI